MDNKITIFIFYYYWFFQKLMHCDERFSMEQLENKEFIVALVTFAEIKVL